jgi:glycosyltransferase involved in cell wall biosynthesis
MITYNHEKFIQEAIECVIQQKTDFEIELVIGEDFSKDSTNIICQEYSNTHPKLIKLLHTEINLGVIPNFIRTLEACTGKYIALCEGDDYWTDPYKLQKQVDFLDANPEFSLCFHNALYSFEDGRDSFPAISNEKSEYNIVDLFSGNFIPTCSIVFRSENIKHFPDWFLNYPFGDWMVNIINASVGKIGYLNEMMGVYRIHSGNVWANSWSNKNHKKVIVNFPRYISFLKRVNEYLNREFEKEIIIAIHNFKYKRLMYHYNNLILSFSFFKDFSTCLYYSKSMNYSVLFLLKVLVLYICRIFKRLINFKNFSFENN